MPFDVTPTTSPVIELLRAGRARIAAGWCQRAWSHRGRYCALGAVKCGIATVDISDEVRYLIRALGFPVEYGPGVVFTFNDDPTTTQIDVLALYDRAIALAVVDALAA